MVKETEYYDILQISTNASQEEISTSYKNLAKKTHPDRNRNDPDASAKFQKLNEANEILSDPEKRQLYDNLGKDFDKQQQSGPSPEDLFSMFGMGGMPGMPGMRQRQEQKENIVLQHSVTLEQLYNEEQIDIIYKQKHVCSTCNGETGKCDTCKQICCIECIASVHKDRLHEDSNHKCYGNNCIEEDIERK